MNAPRKKSPKAPSMGLAEALDKAMTVYDKEGRHTVATSVVAQDIGYKDASSGAALSTLAAIKYYGLFVSSTRGQLAVSVDVEEYRYSTDENKKRELLIKWLRCPQIYATLLDAFPDRLPSDAAITYELIKLGFVEKTAKTCLKLFKSSIEFSGYYEQPSSTESNAETPVTGESEMNNDTQTAANASVSTAELADENVDRIPIRLAGGRKAWLEVPLPFYEKDKEMIKKYVDIIVVDEEE